MSRPLYETESDLTREGDMASAVEKAWKCNLMKLPIRYELDYVLRREYQTVAFCEMKTKSFPYENLDKNGGYAISLGKWMTAKTMSETSVLPFVLIVKLTDGLYYSTFGDGHNSFKPDDMVISGRVDRGDWQDMEPHVIIRANKFKKLKDS
jgi:hypothetical protein